MAGSEFDQAFAPLRALKLEQGEEVVTGVCYGCGRETRIGQIEYEQDMQYPGGVRVTVARRLPGEVCSSEECGATFRASGLDNRFRRAVAESFANLGDPRLKRQQERMERRLQSAMAATTPIPGEVVDRLRSFED